jgi:ATP-dependent Clp protease ATP-binding subunit ClpB
MTSNLGASFLNASSSEGPISSETKELVHGAIRSHFAPEFINRIDAIIVSLFGDLPFRIRLLSP